MEMTKGDIIQEYKQAKNRRAQITILADQNLVSEQDIVDILTAGGCDVPSYKYRKTCGAKKTAPAKKPAPKKTEPIQETVTETIPRSMATRMIVEAAALETMREFLADKTKTWDEFCWFVSGVVDLVCSVGKRCEK